MDRNPSCGAWLAVAWLLGCADPAPAVAPADPAPAAQDPVATPSPAPAAPAVVAPPAQDPWDAVLSQMPTRDCDADGWCVVYELQEPTKKWLGWIWPQDGELFIAGGYGAVAHYDGKDWTLYHTPAGTKLKQIRGSSANDMYAVGTMLTVVHWDGTTWTAEVGPKGDPRGFECVDLRVAGPGDVYVTCHTPGPNRILHRRNGVWSEVDAVPESVPPAIVAEPPGWKRDFMAANKDVHDVIRLGSHLLTVTRSNQVRLGPAEPAAQP